MKQLLPNPTRKPGKGEEPAVSGAPSPTRLLSFLLTSRKLHAGKQALKQIPVGTVGIWVSRAKRRDWNSHLLNAYHVLLTLPIKIVVFMGWGVHRDLGSNSNHVLLLTMWFGQGNNFSELVSS